MRGYLERRNYANLYRRTAKRLKKFYDNFSRGIEALIRRYEMEQGDDVWLCTYKLKEIGCDLEKWEKERGDQ